MLGISQTDLAASASLSRQTVVDFERGVRTPYRNNLAAIRAALEAAGVEFTDGDAPGVRLRPRPWVVEVYATGQEAGPTSHRTFEEFAPALAWLMEQKRTAAKVRIIGPPSGSNEERQAIQDAGGEPTFR